MHFLKNRQTKHQTTTMANLSVNWLWPRKPPVQNLILEAAPGKFRKPGQWLRCWEPRRWEEALDRRSGCRAQSGSLASPWWPGWVVQSSCHLWLPSTVLTLMPASDVSPGVPDSPSKGSTKTDKQPWPLTQISFHTVVEASSSRSLPLMPTWALSPHPWHLARLTLELHTQLKTELGWAGLFRSHGSAGWQQEAAGSSRHWSRGQNTLQVLGRLLEGAQLLRDPLRDLNLHASWGAGVCSMSTAEGVQTGSGGQSLGSTSAVWCLPPTFPGGASGKEPTCQCRRHRDVGSIPGSGISLGGGHGNPLQYSWLENPMDKGAWPATVHSVTKIQD